MQLLFMIVFFLRISVYFNMYLWMCSFKSAYCMCCVHRAHLEIRPLSQCSLPEKIKGTLYYSTLYASVSQNRFPKPGNIMGARLFLPKHYTADLNNQLIIKI